MHTYDARAARAAWFLMIGLSVATLSTTSGLVRPALGATTTTTTTTGTSTPIPLSLGFSQSALYPVSEGVPVYTVGDTVWAVSDYNTSVVATLISPKAGSSATTIVASTTLFRDAIIPLYTFTTKDPDGVWNITLATSPHPIVVIPVHFVNLAAHSVSFGPFAYSLEGSDLMMSAAANLGDSYDQEVCAAGNDTSTSATVGLPTDMGEAGNATLSPGSPFGVTVDGTLNEPFSFWVELYHSYSLDVMNTNNLVSEDLMAAASPPVPFSTTGTVNTTLTWDLPVHEGQYEMRAYFQNSTSLDVVQSTIIVLSASSWVSLDDACLPQAVQSSDISYSSDLTNGPSSWPANFYFMYESFGVGAIASFPVMANLSSVSFSSSPWDLTSLSVIVAPSAGVVQTSQEGGTLFVLSSQYPTKVAYTLDVNGEKDIAQGNATIVKSYSALTRQINLGLLTVKVISNRDLTSTLDVTGPSNISLSSGPVGLNQSASFFLPTGTYTVTGVQANESQVAQTNVKDGATDSLVLTFHTIDAPKGVNWDEAIEIILIGIAAAAIVANIVLRLRRSKSLGARMANAPGPQATP